MEPFAIEDQWGNILRCSDCIPTTVGHGGHCPLRDKTINNYIGFEGALTTTFNHYF